MVFILDRRQLCEALLSTTGDEGAAHCAKRAKRIFAQRARVWEVSPTSLLSCYKGGEIWAKEKVQPLKILYALFLEPHTRC